MKLSSVARAAGVVVLAAIVVGCGRLGDGGSAGSDSSIPGYSVIRIRKPGKVTGSVTLMGDLPDMPSFTIDDKACAQASAYNRLEVGRNRGVASVVVYLDGITEGKPVPEIAPEDLTIDQRGCQYAPHIIAAPIGATVRFVNSDNVPHNVRVQNAASDSMIFNRAQPVEGRVDSMVVREAGPELVGCDYHPWMNAYIFGMKSPYYAVTDRDGRFEIDDIPPGNYSIKIWINGVGLKPMLDNQGKLIRYEFGEPFVRERPVSFTGNDSLDYSFEMNLGSMPWPDSTKSDGDAKRKR
jgi:plastocyanin